MTKHNGDMFVMLGAVAQRADVLCDACPFHEQDPRVTPYVGSMDWCRQQWRAGWMLAALGLLP